MWMSDIVEALMSQRAHYRRFRSPTSGRVRRLASDTLLFFALTGSTTLYVIERNGENSNWATFFLAVALLIPSVFYFSIRSRVLIARQARRRLR